MIRTRFAPSPTGFLHVGGVRTALFSWAFARAHAGACLLRIEDTDRERSRPEAIEAILSGLAWLGLTFDGPVIYQTQRLARYQAVIEDLLARGYAYRCYMTAEALDALRAEQKSRGEKPRYDKRWHPDHRTRWGLEEPTEPTPHVIRFRTPDTGYTGFTDLIKGYIEVNNAELDDFIIMRSDGTPTYNFCVVVDDIDMQITHVIRGDDHINNTPRQHHVFEAMGYTPPQYAHLPMIAGPDGQKLSKRHGAVSVLAYEIAGFLPETLLNYLARLGWSCGDLEIFDRETFVRLFSLSQVQNAPARFDSAKLSWMNQAYIKQLEPSALQKVFTAFLSRHGDTALQQAYAQAPETQCQAWLSLYQSRVHTLQELQEAAHAFFLPPPALQALEDPHCRPVLETIMAALAHVDWTVEDIGQMIKSTTKRAGLPLNTIGHHLRLMLLGQTHSPAFAPIIYLLGREDSRRRLQASLHTSPQ